MRLNCSNSSTYSHIFFLLTLLVTIVRQDVTASVVRDNNTTSSPVVASSTTTTTSEKIHHDDGCGVRGLNDSSSISPITFEPKFGPEVGGTIVHITNLPQCLDEPNIEIYCRFQRMRKRHQGTAKGLISKGERISRNHIACITPYIGETSKVAVSYAIIQDSLLGLNNTKALNDESFDTTSTNWIEGKQEFYYNDKQAGVVVITKESNGNNPSTIDDTVAGTIFNADETISIKWNMETLLLTAFENYRHFHHSSLPTSTSSYDDNLSVGIDIMILDQKLDDIVVVQSIPLLVADDIYIDSTRLQIDQSMIEPYLLTPDYYDNVLDSSSSSFAIVLFRVVIMYKDIMSDRRQILSTHTSHPNFVQTASTIKPTTTTKKRVLRLFDSNYYDESNDVCPMKPLSDCPGFETTPPCPPTYTSPSNFQDDDGCPFPVGDEPCISSEEMTINDIESYYYNIKDINNNNNRGNIQSCLCQFFHNGASGCTRSGNSQCCYDSDGILILDPLKGAGTFDCTSPQQSVFRHQIEDVLPFIRCCKLGTQEQCIDYLTQRPPITSDGYEEPSP